MKPIKIDPKNAREIHAALDAVNGKARTFTVQMSSEVRAFAQEAEAQLAMLPKQQRVGARAVCRPEGPKAGYKYPAKSTGLALERRATGWFLVNVTETTVYPKSRRVCDVTITREQADEIQRRSITDFVVA